MFGKNNKKQQQDEGYDFSDIQNPLNDSSRVGLMGNRPERSNKYQKDQSNFEDMFDENQDKGLAAGNGGGTKSHSNKNNASNKGPKAGSASGTNGNQRLSVSSQQMENGPTNGEEMLSAYPQNKSSPSGTNQIYDNLKKVDGTRRQSENVHLPQNNESFDQGLISRQKSSVSQMLGVGGSEQHMNQKENTEGNGMSARGNLGPNNNLNDSQNNIMIEAQLIENVNKRSEAANRKYRAFVHFLKYEKNHNPEKKNQNGKANASGSAKVNGTKGNNNSLNGSNGITPDHKMGGGNDKMDNTATQGQSAPQIDDLSQASDADDDFDDRYIHLSNHQLL